MLAMYPSIELYCLQINETVLHISRLIHDLAFLILIFKVRSVIILIHNVVYIHSYVYIYFIFRYNHHGTSYNARSNRSVQLYICIVRVCNSTWNCSCWSTKILHRHLVNQMHLLHLSDLTLLVITIILIFYQHLLTLHTFANISYWKAIHSWVPQVQRYISGLFSESTTSAPSSGTTAPGELLSYNLLHARTLHRTFIQIIHTHKIITLTQTIWKYFHVWISCLKQVDITLTTQ